MFCYGYALGAAPIGGTEGNRALTGHQMLASGQWIIPHLYDQIYLKKPPLDYWILALAEKIAGAGNPWIWRLPSAIGTALVGAALCAFSNRWFGRPAGLVAGVSHLAMVALWEQARSADIDALNSLAVVLGACGILHLELVHGRRKIIATLLTGLALGASLMLKGPTGWTLIIGALAAAGWRKPWAWVSIFLGIAIFGLYALKVSLKMKASHLAPDTSGLDEAIDKSNILRHPLNFLKALGLPIILLAYSFPVSLGVLFALNPAVRGPMVIRILRTIAVGSAACVLMGIFNPRYAYVILPMICPLAGAVVVAWRDHRLSEKTVGQLKFCVAAIPAIFLIFSVQLAILCWSRSPARDVLTAVALGSLFLAILTYMAISRQKWEIVGLGIVLLIVMAGIPFSTWNNLDRMRRSAYPAGIRLGKIVPPGTKITAGMLPVDHPELFYYAQVTVESHMAKFAHPVDFPDSRWIILDDVEYAAWSSERPGALESVVTLWPEHKSAFLGWYRAASDVRKAPAATLPLRPGP